MKKAYKIYRLEDAVAGISNTGIEYDEYTHTLAHVTNEEFESVEAAESALGLVLRNRGKKDRFCILPTYSDL